MTRLQSGSGRPVLKTASAFFVVEFDGPSSTRNVHREFREVFGVGPIWRVLSGSVERVDRNGPTVFICGSFIPRSAPFGQSNAEVILNGQFVQVGRMAARRCTAWLITQ